jgi:ubiquinone/menaquinone biosynthesis C-methylase UbiE
MSPPMSEEMTNQIKTSSTPGLVLHWAARYDLLIWLLTFGREQALRQKLVRLARLKPGESVLDVGCGTGTLAIAAKRQVGPEGSVAGLDASPEMIARAAKKAKKAGIEVTFQEGPAQALPFPEAQFDVVLMTVMLHHLPRKVRQVATGEARRVLKPGGRVLAVEFGASREKKGILDHLHRHGQISPRDTIALLSEAGFSILESGAVGTSNLHFVLAVAPEGA